MRACSFPACRTSQSGLPVLDQIDTGHGLRNDLLHAHRTMSGTAKVVGRLGLLPLLLEIHDQVEAAAADEQQRRYCHQ